MLPLPERDAQLDALMVHELTHLLVSEIILPGTGGDGGVPRWVHEGIASYMAGAWPDDHERLMRELVASGDIPALSQLSGTGGFTNVRLNDALGHVAFDYIESRWGPASIRRFLNALIVPRVGKTYDAVFDLTPAEFDAAFRQYAERRFRLLLIRWLPSLRDAVEQTTKPPRLRRYSKGLQQSQPCGGMVPTGENAANTATVLRDHRGEEDRDTA